MRHHRFLLLLSGFSALAHSQQITSLTGKVSIRAADDAPWSAALPGMAIAKGASISAGPKATVDIRVDPSDSFVAEANSQVKYAGVDNDRYQVELIAGKLTYQAADPATDSLRVNLPGVGVEPVQPGIYAIAHAAGGQSQISVQTGLVRVVAPTGAELVDAGQKMLVRYTANGPEFRVVNAFSRWRRFLTITVAALQIAGNVSAAIGESGGSESSQKAVAPPGKSISSAPKPVDTRQRSDPPPKSAPAPSSPPPAAAKAK